MAKGEPLWITSKYGGKCSGDGCGKFTKKGERVFYDPSSKTVFCGTCGQKAEMEYNQLAGK